MIFLNGELFAWPLYDWSSIKAFENQHCYHSVIVLLTQSLCVLPVQFRASLTSYTLKRFYFVPTHTRSASSRSHSYPVRPRAQYDLPFTEIYERDFNNLLSGDVRRPFESVWEPRLSRRGNKNELITEPDLVSLVIKSENTKKVILT